MAFRADEAAREGLEELLAYLVPRPSEEGEAERLRSRKALESIANDFGPAVDSYPSWHPLVWSHKGPFPVTKPSDECGYKSLDHTSYLANGFISCPYGAGQAERIIASVNALPFHPVAEITAKRLDVRLYRSGAVPVLVKCKWKRPLLPDGTIPASIATPLLLHKEIPRWTKSSVAETWDNMRPYFMGRPHGSRSSLFLNQQTGQTIKKIWDALIETGMYGPIEKRGFLKP